MKTVPVQQDAAGKGFSKGFLVDGFLRTKEPLSQGMLDVISQINAMYAPLFTGLDCGEAQGSMGSIPSLAGLRGAKTMCDIEQEKLARKADMAALVQDKYRGLIHD